MCPNCKESQPRRDGQLASPYCVKCRFPIKPLAGVYHFDKRLGAGGFGIVYLGRHRENHQIYAIKVLRPELMDQLAASHLDPLMGEKKKEEILNRFQQEIRVTTELSKESPHIVHIFDVGEDPTYGHYYIMEYLRGVTLDRHLRAGEALPLLESLHIFEQLCQAVSTAHRGRIIHRDLKPSNVFLLPMPDGKFFVKVIDFGIAKSLLAANNMTQTGGVVGSMKYIAPEQAKGEAVDQRTDIYSLAGLLYRLLTGTPPFTDEGQTALLLAHLQKPVEALSSRRPDLSFPVNLDIILRKALAKAPEDRFSDVESFWQALQQEASLATQQNPGGRLPTVANHYVTLVEGSPAMRALWEEGKKAGYVSVQEPPKPSKELLFSDNEDLSFNDLPMEDEEDTMMFMPGMALRRGPGSPPGPPPSLAQSGESQSLFAPESKSELFEDDYFDEAEFSTTPGPTQKPDLRQTRQVRPQTPARFATMPDDNLSQAFVDQFPTQVASQALSEAILTPRPDNRATTPLFDPTSSSDDQSRHLKAAMGEELGISKALAVEESNPPADEGSPFFRTQMDPTNDMMEQLRAVAAAYDSEQEAKKAQPEAPDEDHSPGDETMLSIPRPQSPSQMKIGGPYKLSPPSHTLGEIEPLNIAPAPRPATKSHTLSGSDTGRKHSLESAALVRDPLPEAPTSISPSGLATGDLLTPARRAPTSDTPKAPAAPAPDAALSNDLDLEDDLQPTEFQPSLAPPTTKRSKAHIWLLLLPFALIVTLGGVWYFAMMKANNTTPAKRRTTRKAPPKRVAPRAPAKRPAAKLQPSKFKAGTIAKIAGLPDARLVWLPPGRFQLGSPKAEVGRFATEGPLTKVTITRGFWIWSTEVTQGQYKAVMKTNPSRFSKCGASCPVESVSWYQAAQFANALSKQRKLEPCYICKKSKTEQGKSKDKGKKKGKRKGKKAPIRCELHPKWRRPKGHHYQCPGYRLPTEAEWEYAARAGSAQALYTGNHTKGNEIDAKKIEPLAWFNDNSDVKYKGAFQCADNNKRRRCGTHPVGKKQPNKWKLHDMLGNVWEWVADGFRPTYPGRDLIDPLLPPTKLGRIGRGGSWNSKARLIRSANRGRLDPKQTYSSVGFRLVRSEP